jgi:hypothetical protein
MQKSVIVLAASCVLVGCATVRLDATPGPCKSTDSVAVTTFAPLEAAKVQMLSGQPLSTAFAAEMKTVVPFNRAAPSDAEIASLRTMATELTAKGKSLSAAGAQSLASAKAADPTLQMYLDSMATVPWAAEVQEVPDTKESSAAGVGMAAALRELVTQATEASHTLVASKQASLTTIKSSSDLNPRLHKAVQAGGDAVFLQISAAALARQYAAFVKTEQSQKATQEEQVRLLAERVIEFEIGRFVWVYMRAYFRNGRIFQAELKTKQFEDSFIAFVKSKLPPTTPLTPDDEKKLRSEFAEKLAAACRENGDAGCFLTSMGKDKLVTRSGETIQFKGISLAVGYDQKLQTALEYPKSVEFGPQLVRVAMEASFDALPTHVPAAPSATACTPFGESKVQLYPPKDCMTEDTLSKDTALEKRVADIDEKASRADSLAANVSGQLIRLGSVIALNNEAVAKSVENLAGVTARKVTEQVAWRHSLSCNNSAVPSLYLDLNK